MDPKPWLLVVAKAAADPELAETLARYLAEVDAARQALRDKGYGVTGTPILRQVEEVPAVDD